MPEIHSTLAESHLTNNHIRPKVALMHCEPQHVETTVIPPIIRVEDIFLSKFESIKMMFNELKLELKRVKTENTEIKEKVEYLEGVTVSCTNRISYLENLATSTIGTNGVLDMEIVYSF